MFNYILDNINKEEYELKIKKCNNCSLPGEICDCSFSDVEDDVDKLLKDDIKCCYCIKCPYPINMLDKIIIDNKEYIVCDDNKCLLYNKIMDEKKNKLYISGTNKFIYEDIFNIDLDIFDFNVFTYYSILNEYKKSIELDRKNGLNSNKYYLNFIKSLPWTEGLDKTLDTYTNCNELMENHFRKKPDKPNIIFCKLPIEYNIIYYEYIFWATECIECQKDEDNNCIIYNKLWNFLNKKRNKKN